MTRSCSTKHAVTTGYYLWRTSGEIEVSFKTIDAATYGVGSWVMTARPRRPYAFETVAVVERNDPNRSKMTTRIGDRRFLPTPIHPHLFALKPGDANGFIDFVETLGLTEWMPWLAADRFGVAPPEAWGPIIGQYEKRGARQLPREWLINAWTDPTTVDRYDRVIRYLRDAFELVTQLPDTDAADFVVDFASYIDSMQIETIVVESRGRPRLIEVPTDIISRAWWELVDSLSLGGRLPRTCPYCKQPFAPTRPNQRYCPGTDHQARGSDRTRNQDPWRREDNRLRARLRRATTPEAKKVAEQELRRHRERRRKQ